MNTQTLTTDQIQRVQRDWSLMAKEEVDVQIIGGVFYGFCSELAALRIERKYDTTKGTAKADYSKNLNSWFFRLETSL